MPKAATVSPAREEITVDTAQADPKKQVQRTTVDRGDTKGQEPEAWLDRSKSVKRRMAQFGRNLTNDLTRQFQQTRAEDEAKWQKELAKRDQEINRLKVDQSTVTTDSQHEAEIADLQSKLEAAFEGGDSKEQARLTALISRKEAAHIQKKTDSMVGRQASDKKDEGTAQVQTQQRGSPKAERFIRATKWWDDPEFAAEKGAANEIHRQLVEAGSDPESDEHYRRINKALKKKFPELDLTDPDDMYDSMLGLDDDDEDESGDKKGGGDNEDGESRQRRREPVQQFHDRGGNQNGSGRLRTVRLDDADIATMVAMKMDPKDDAAVSQYAKAKAERLAQEG